MSADIGLIGLAVMGQNLVLNMLDHDFSVAVFNRTTSKVTDFMAEEAKEYKKAIGCTSVEDFCAALKKPRRIVILVRAGSAVDQTIEGLLPHLEKGDILIDGGNSNFNDTERRFKELGDKGFLFVGSGVSGGEEGARNGPSIMPGGSEEAWPHIKEIFQAISAKSNGEPCCDWVGPGSAGHYVKMVHNGIEYGDMQLICEAYHILKDLGTSTDDMAAMFEEWNKGELESYLIEITAKILAFKDEAGKPLVESIRDTAGQKGTGKWTAIEALDLGIPLTMIGEAVFARCVSALIEDRADAAGVLKGPDASGEAVDQKALRNDLKDALLASKIVSYAQGFMLLREAAKERKWGQLNYGGVALMWRGGCIIRSAFLGKIKDAFTEKRDLSNLMLAPYFAETLQRCQAGWRRVVSLAIRRGIPCPAFSAALNFYDSIRTRRLPANLLQAQRDYFGAHTYELLDSPGTWHHANWTGTTGRVTSNSYNA
eukprot:NODE_970_length_1647_cov_27.124531_g800_i0.p1 GENE.NODE_970_length_1647_cov_27.124531_g800_i0~~NODE_970_length_1647_cov_27.124531_g800_i0.p1  ORF type:complete len:483 (-),score=122.42 NODE_970_length_1647_cov_27.124531_g800_i0:110-1558(-)